MEQHCVMDPLRDLERSGAEPSLQRAGLPNPDGAGVEPGVQAAIVPAADAVAAQAVAAQAARWEALRCKDPAADGHFVYSVRSTGVYCRPSCPARPARREQIAFHDTCAAAEQAGFRPCLRCRPDGASQAQRHAEAVAQACRRIEAVESSPRLDELARGVGLSPSHFHRIFKASTGVTPKAYAAAHRARRVAEGLRSAATVTEAVYDAGFGSSSRFYAASNARLGMTPSAYRRGGSGTQIRFAIGECSLGSILVAATPRGICAIALGQDPEALVRELEDSFPAATLQGGDSAFEQMVATVIGFVEAPTLGLDLPLDIGGTAFQTRVWAALQAIPPGTTASYSDIAAAIGAHRAVRAVARACAANTLAVAIPCHRVIRSDGHLSGYRWGIERKQALLDRERQAASEPGSTQA